jgi:hypothetical protein
MKNSLIAAMGVALVASLGSVSVANATTNIIDFAAGPSSGHASYAGSHLGNATTFDMGTTSFTVGAVGSDDTTGVASGDSVSITPDYVITLAVGGLSHDLTKAWTTSQGAFVETLTSINYVGGFGNFLNVSFLGTVTGPGFSDVAASMSLAASQNGGPGHSIAYSISDSATATVASGVPEASTWTMMLAGFAALGFAGYRRKAVTFAA